MTNWFTSIFQSRDGNFYCGGVYATEDEAAAATSNPQSRRIAIANITSLTVLDHAACDELVRKMSKLVGRIEPKA